MAKVTHLTSLMKDVNKMMDKVVASSNKLADLAAATTDLVEDAAQLVSNLIDEVLFQEEEIKKELAKHA